MFTDDGIVEFWENQRFWGLTWGVPLLPFDWPAWSDAQGNAIQLTRAPEREGERGWFVVRTLGTDEEGWRYSTVFSKLTTPRPGGRASKRSSDYVRSRVWRKLAAHAPILPDREMQPLAFFTCAARSHQLEYLASGGGGGDDSDTVAAAAADNLTAMASPAADGLPAVATSGPAGVAAAVVAANAAAAQGGTRPPPRLDPEAERILLSAVAAYRMATGAAAGTAGGALPKPSLFKLWQLFMELWNDACARHGMRRLVPLDPLGLYVAARRHRELLARQRAAQLGRNRLVAAVPVSTEIEPDILDAQSDAQQQSLAAAGGLQQAEAAGAGSAAAAEAAMAAAAASAAASASQHRSPTVGETPTGAAIMQPAAPQPVTLHRSGPGGGVWDPEFRSASITGPPGRATAVTAGGSGGAGGGSNGAEGSIDGDGDAHLAADQGLMPNLDDPATLLTELVTGINYARAAYGYVMAAGHLNSLTKLFTMFGSTAHFNPITGASAEANLEAIFLFTGIPVEDVVMAEWRSSVFRPCHYLAVDRRRRRLVLAVRGSLELSDIATDLTARPVEFDFGGGMVGHVHQGLMSAASYVQLNTAAALRSAAERFPGWPLLVTGHSLGAGVAALLTLLLQQRSAPMGAPAAVPAVHCLAIGPPAVLSANLAEAARGCIVSVINQGDFVARLSCYSVDRALLELVQASPAAQMADTFLQSTGATLAAIQQRLAAFGGGSGDGGTGGGGFDGFAFLGASMGWRGASPQAEAGGQSGTQTLRGREVEMVSSPRRVGEGGWPWRAMPAGLRGSQLASSGQQPAARNPTCSAGLKDIPLLAGCEGPGHSHRNHNHNHHGHHNHHGRSHAHTHIHQHSRHRREHQAAAAAAAAAIGDLTVPAAGTAATASEGTAGEILPTEMHVATAAAANPASQCAASAGAEHPGLQARTSRPQSDREVDPHVVMVHMPPPLDAAAAGAAVPVPGRGPGGGTDGGSGAGASEGGVGDEEDDYSIVSARSGGGSESGMSYHSAASPNESYMSAASSPLSRISVSFEEALDAGFLYRAVNPTDHGGGGSGASVSYGRLTPPLPSGLSQPLPGGDALGPGSASGTGSGYESRAAGSQHDDRGPGRRHRATAAGWVTAAAAAAVGGVPYTSPQPRRVLEQAAAVAIPTASGRHHGGMGLGVETSAAAYPAALDTARYAAMTPPTTPPRQAPSRGDPEGMVTAAEGWGLGFFGGGSGAGGGRTTLRPSSDPLASRGPLYQRAVSDDEYEDADEIGDVAADVGGTRMVLRGGGGGGGRVGPGGWRMGSGGGGGRRRRARSGSRREQSGSGAGGNGESFISWDALSRNLMTSWFGQGYFDDEDEEERGEQGQGRPADGGQAREAGAGGGSGGFAGWWMAAMAGMSPAAAATMAPPQAATTSEAAGGQAELRSGGSGLTSCWPGLEEPPGPHRHPDATGTALRGKYGAPPLGALSWPWPEPPQPLPFRSAASAGTQPARASGQQRGRERDQAAAPAAGDSNGAGGRAAGAVTGGTGGAGRDGGGGGGGGRARPGRVQHRHSRSAPSNDLFELLPPTEVDEAPPGAAATGEVRGTEDEFGGRSGRHGPASHDIEADVSDGTGPSQPGEQASAGAGPGLEAADAGGAAGSTSAAGGSVPHYIHSVHKELYPPGRLLWIVIEDPQVLPPADRGQRQEARGSGGGAATGPQAPCGGGSGAETRGTGATTAITQPAAVGNGTGGAATNIAATAAESAGAGTGAGAGARTHGSGRSVDASTAQGPVSSDRTVPYRGGSRLSCEARQSPHIARSKSLEPADEDSYSLLDLSLVTDLMQGLVSGPTSSAAVQTGRAPSHGAAATGSAAASEGADAPGRPPRPSSGSKRQRPSDRERGSFSGGEDGQQGLQASGMCTSASATVVTAAAVVTPAGVGRGDSGCLPSPLDPDRRSGGAPSGSPQERGGSRGGSGGGTAATAAAGGSAAGDSGGGVGSSTPFAARVREGLKRIKSGVETMLRQAPLPSVPSVPFLQGACGSGSEGAADAAGIFNGPAWDGQPEAAAGGASGASGPGRGQWVYLVEAEREVFERMALIPTSITDHLPDAYVQRLRQLAKGFSGPPGTANGDGRGGEPGAGPGPAAAVRM